VETSMGKFVTVANLTFSCTRMKFVAVLTDHPNSVSSQGSHWPCLSFALAIVSHFPIRTMPCAVILADSRILSASRSRDRLRSACGSRTRVARLLRTCGAS